MPLDRVRDRSEAIKVSGLSAIQKELKGADRELLKRIQGVNKDLAETVADKARTRIRSPRTGRHGESGLTKVAASIKARATATTAKIEGGVNAPTFFGEEFGGGAKPTTRQFPKHRGKAGTFLYPTIREQVEEHTDDWLEQIDKLFPAQQPRD